MIKSYRKCQDLSVSQSAAIEVTDPTCPLTLVSTLYVQRSEYDAYTALAVPEQRILHAVLGLHRWDTAWHSSELVVVLLCQLST